MRSILSYGLPWGISLLAVLLAGPSLAAPRKHAHPAALPTPPAVPAKSSVGRPAVFAEIEHATWGRVSIVLHGAEAPMVQQVAGGVELHFAPGVRVEVPPRHELRELAGIETSMKNGVAVAVLRLACDCTVMPENAPDLLRLDIREKRKGTGVTEAKTPKEVRGKPGEAAELMQLRETLAERLKQLNVPAQGPAPQPAAATSGPGGLTPAGAAAPVTAVAGAQTNAVCPPEFDLADWQKTALVKPKDSFQTRLQRLRREVSDTHNDADQALAKLAKFYLSNGLAGEADDVAREALDAAPAAQRAKLAALVGISRLLTRSPVDAGTAPIVITTGCDRPDVPLWRALSAAAAGDVDILARNADAAAASLVGLPDPLVALAAFHLADAGGDNRAILRAMGGAVRNLDLPEPEDDAARFLLQARLARLDNDTPDELVYLERAARHTLTAPGIIARARLAGLRAAEDGPDAADSEKILADIARAYRYEALGQDTAETLAETRLRHGDYAAALDIADESAGPVGGGPRQSRGAALAARILRILLVDPPGIAKLPDPYVRLALYWRYEGYATPGEKGDDIRMGAARVMLTGGLPDAAREVLQHLAPTTAATPAAQTLRAAAEARAGDAGFALQLLPDPPTTDLGHRIAAIAMARLDRPAEGAQQLDALPGRADRLQRARLLFDAQSWSAAADAYAALLRDAEGLDDAVKLEAAQRYALAATLAGQTPAKGLPKAEGAAARWLAVAASPDAASGQDVAGQDAVSAARAAVERAHAIETLLPAQPAKGS